MKFPIAIAVMITFIAYHYGLFTNVEAAKISGSDKWLASFFPHDLNVLGALKEAIYDSILLGKATMIPQLWTVKIEFIGSLYLLIFYIIKPKSHTAIPMLMFFCLIYLIHDIQSIYYFAIFFGSILSRFHFVAKYKLYLFSIGMYFGSYLSGHPAYNFLPEIKFFGVQIWDTKTFYMMIGALLITLSIIQGFGAKLLGGKMSQFLGKISFSLYLIHMTVLCVLSTWIYIYFPQEKKYFLFNFFVYIGVSLIISLIFERYVDRSAINISHKFASKLFLNSSDSVKP